MNSLNDSLYVLLSRVRLPLPAQEAYAQDPANYTALSNNPYLDPVVWEKIVHSGPHDAALAEALVSRPLARQQIDEVLSREKRLGVLVALAQHNDLDLDQIDALTSRVQSGSLASSLYRIYGPRHTAAELLAARANVAERLDWVSFSEPELLSDDEALEFLKGLNVAWGTTHSYKARSTSLKRLFARRPALLEVVREKGLCDAIYTAAAGDSRLGSLELQLAVLGLDSSSFTGLLNSRSRFSPPEFTSLALINNPRALPEVIKLIADHAVSYNLVSAAQSRLDRHSTSTKPFGETSDPKHLVWLVNRLAPRYTATPVYSQVLRPYALAELALNPYLNADQAKRVADTLVDPEVIAEIGQVRASELRENLARSHGFDVDESEEATTTSTWSYSVPTNMYPSGCLARELEAQIAQDGAEASVIGVLGDNPHAWSLLGSLLAEHPNEKLARLVKMAKVLSTSSD